MKHPSPNHTAIDEKVSAYWQALKLKYPNFNLKEEYDLWMVDRKKDKKPEPYTKMSALQFFEKDWLIKKKNKVDFNRIGPLPTDDEYQRKNLAETNKQRIHRLLSDWGLPSSNELNALIYNACYQDRLLLTNVNDWLNSQGDRPSTADVYTQELYQLILKQKSGKSV